MAEENRTPPTPLDAFLAAFWKDVENDAIRPLADYLAKFPGDDAAIAGEYRAAMIRVSSGSSRTAGEPSSDRIAHYKIIRQIGRGGQATVYLADDTRLHRQVALKVMDPGFAAERIAVERFRREAEITSKLDHPGICTVYETGEAGSTLWIAMRYVEGESLAKMVSSAKEGLASGSTSAFVVLSEPSGQDEAPPALSAPTDRTGPRTWTDISRLLLLFENAARALHAAHEVGIIHRDVKPGNMIVAKDGTPVILDFGLAQDVEGNQPTLTLQGDLMGTPAYMSPEQVASHRIKLDRRTDVYSLGVSLYECLTLRRPFDAATREGLYQAILTKDPPDPRRLNPALTSDLRIVVATAIEKDRSRRYQTALDLAEELRRVRQREPIAARPVGWLVRLARWAQRNPALAAATAGLFGMLSIGLAAALVLLGQRDRALADVTSERNRKETALADYERLGDLPRLQRLQTEADLLWPCEPSKVPEMKAWIEEAAALAQRFEGHKAVLEAVRKGGRAANSEPPEGRNAGTRPSWRFATDAMQFKHDTTARLVAGLELLSDPDPKRGLLAAVRARLEFSESVERETIGRYETQWAEAVSSIANETECPRYGGLRIRPQPGLIPIGRDPHSGLWEFIHLQTTAPGEQPVPIRGADGRLVVTEGTGLVFVLLPGATFTMGAVRPHDEETAPADANLDPQAERDESPMTTVTLDPFFLSKYEMTQGQWARFVGRNPSQWGPGAGFGGKLVDARNPVEHVSWEDCEVWLGRLGLALPTEAQWEYAARGETATPRWTNDLAAAANLADAFCRNNGGPSSWTYEAWDDGHAVHAPAGTYAPNPFGLHEILGNVWEWCSDWKGSYTAPPRAHDGLRSPPPSSFRVCRGGGWRNNSSFARSAFRFNNTPDYRSNDLGVRPARAYREE